MEMPNFMTRTKHVLMIGIAPVVLLTHRIWFMIVGVNIDECGFHDNYAGIMNKRRYDMVITQILNPLTGNKDGIKVINLVRERHPAVKVLVISLFGSAEEKELTWRSGGAQYLAAPTFADLVKAFKDLGIINGDNSEVESNFPAPAARTVTANFESPIGSHCSDRKRSIKNALTGDEESLDENFLGQTRGDDT